MDSIVFLRSKWIAKKTNKCITEKINLEFSFDTEMKGFKYSHFMHIMKRPSSPEKSKMLKNTERG